MDTRRQSDITQARETVRFWEEDIKTKEKRARGWLASAADKEDYHFAVQRLRKAQAELRRLEQT